MIPKVPDNRRDGRSSFQDLGKYITAGIENNAQPPTSTSWDRLTQYITQPAVLDALGDAVEKTIGVEIGNVASLATAAAEMYAVAKKNSRAKNPVYHYILSWPEHERPSTAQIFEAVRYTLAALGMAEHQYIAAIHANTDNLHAHVEVNRVHPQTYLAVPLGFDHKTLHRAARELEIRFGWHHDKGLFNVVEVDGRKVVVEDATFVEDALAKSTSKADSVATWSGEESLQDWCARVPAQALKKVVESKATTSWQAIHQVLADHGLELAESGGGGFVVRDLSGTQTRGGRPTTVAASKAFRFLRRGVLESRIGAFEPRIEGASVPAPTRTYKRDPEKRLQRRLERKAARDDLKARFASERQKSQLVQSAAKRAIAPLYAEDKRRLAALANQYAADRAAIQSDRSLSGRQKQQAYMLLKLTTTKAREQLKESIAREQRERKSLLPPVLSWRSWVEEMAKAGDEAAISALRGMAYQAGRERRRAGVEGVADAVADADVVGPAGNEGLNAIVPAEGGTRDPYIRALSRLNWRVTNNGKVHYEFDSGGTAFVDEGNRLTFQRKAVDDDALLISLRYAADKWPNGITITGGDIAFKQRAVRAAVSMGIKITNIELQALQRSVLDEVSAVVRQGARDRGLTAAMTAAELQLRGIDPKARATYIGGEIAVAAKYQGKIVAQTDRYLIQHAGGHDYVIHDKATMRKPPNTTEDVTITYGAGKVVVRRATARGR